MNRRPHWNAGVEDPRLPLPVDQIVRLVRRHHMSLVCELQRLGHEDDEVTSIVIEGMLRRRGYDPTRGWAPSKYVVMVTKQVLLNARERAINQTGERYGSAVGLMDSDGTEVDAGLWAESHLSGGVVDNSQVFEATIARWQSELSNDLDEKEVEALRMMASGALMIEVIRETGFTRRRLVKLRDAIGKLEGRT